MSSSPSGEGERSRAQEQEEGEERLAASPPFLVLNRSEECNDADDGRVTSSGIPAEKEDEEEDKDEEEEEEEEEEPSNFQVFHVRSVSSRTAPSPSSFSSFSSSSSGGRRMLRTRSPNRSLASGRFAKSTGGEGGGGERGPRCSPSGARPRTPMVPTAANKAKSDKEAKPCNDVHRQSSSGDANNTSSSSSSSAAEAATTMSAAADKAREAVNEYWCQFHTAVDLLDSEGGGGKGGRAQGACENAWCSVKEEEEAVLSDAMEKLKAKEQQPHRHPRKDDEDQLEEIKELDLAEAGEPRDCVGMQGGNSNDNNNTPSGRLPVGLATKRNSDVTVGGAAALPTVESASSIQQQQLLPVNSSSIQQQQQQQQQLGMYNWQSTKMTVKERLAFMFNNEILSDVHFLVGKERSQQRIPAHRFVLSVGSAVFDAMFNSTLRTTEDEIALPDVEPTSFLALLRFLYSDEVQIGPETVMTTLYTAKKYAVPALEKHCVDFLKRNLSADNAFMLLTQARLFDEPQLAALCLESIDKFTPEALGAEGFIDIDVATLSAVLDRDSLRIKEAKLFNAVIRWSEAECLRQGLPVTPEKKRSVLGNVLTKIRFPLMTIEEFAQGPAQSGILTDRECVSVFLHFTVNPKPPVGFLDVPRCSMTGKEQTVCRFQQIESRWGYSGTSDKIKFSVDRRIFIVGFGLYGSIHGPSEYQVNIQVFHASGRLLGSNELSFLSDGTNSTFRVMFKEPVEILPNTNYTASATLKGLDSHYGTRGMRRVFVDTAAGGRVNFNFFYAAGNNNGTSVEDGQIPEIIFYT